MPYVTENTRVNIILFVTVDNQEDVLRFINLYTTVCMEKRDKTSLLLVICLIFIRLTDLIFRILGFSLQCRSSGERSRE